MNIRNRIKRLERQRMAGTDDRATTGVIDRIELYARALEAGKTLPWTAQLERFRSAFEDVARREECLDEGPRPA